MKNLANFIDYSNEKKYKELKFVCHNSDYDDSTDKESQLNLYEELKNLREDSDYGILPYMQDFCDSLHDEYSLAVIILDKNNEEELEEEIKNLAESHHVKIDLYNYRNDDEVDAIVRGDLYDNLI